MDREKQVPESIRQAELDFHFVPEMTKEEALMYAPLTLAFLGDAVYELAIRTDLVQEADRSPNMLNRLSSALAKAGAQSIAMEAIEPILNPTLVAIFYGEMLGPLSLVGAAIVMCGILYYNIKKAVS